MLDAFSYQCGVIDCFNEIVGAGVKKLAMSHPVDSPAEQNRLEEFAKDVCKKYGTKLYREDAPLITDLFPASMNRNRYNLLFYREEAILREYLELKEFKKKLETTGQYAGDGRTQVATRFGKLLSYSDEAIRRMILENGEKE